jgi:hypothetical protein
MAGVPSSENELAQDCSQLALDSACTQEDGVLLTVKDSAASLTKAASHQTPA